MVGSRLSPLTRWVGIINCNVFYFSSFFFEWFYIFLCLGDRHPLGKFLKIPIKLIILIFTIVYVRICFHVYMIIVLPAFWFIFLWKHGRSIFLEILLWNKWVWEKAGWKHLYYWARGIARRHWVWTCPCEGKSMYFDEWNIWHYTGFLNEKWYLEMIGFK